MMYKMFKLLQGTDIGKTFGAAFFRGYILKKSR